MHKKNEDDCDLHAFVSVANKKIVQIKSGKQIEKKGRR